MTRQSWRTALGRTFDADVRLTAPDLRAVVTAVELGIGISLLPTYVRARGLAAGTLVRLYDVDGVVPPEPWFTTVRRTDRSDPPVRQVLDVLVGAPGPTPTPAGPTASAATPAPGRGRPQQP